MNDEAASAWCEEEEQSRSRLERFREVLARTEGVYLEILRAIALFIATALLLWIGWLLVSSAYNISRDADAVAEEPVEVTASDVAAIELPTKDPANQGRDESKGKSSETVAFEKFRDDYFKLYQSSFERFRQNDDKPLSRAQFTSKFLSGFDQGSAGSAELETQAFVATDEFPGLLATMREAADLPVTRERLQTYKKTPKKVVKDQVRRSRTESYCSYYSDYFGECFSYDTRTVPYYATVTRLESPSGVLGPQALFGAYQDNYLSKLNSRRDASSSKAARERAERLEANERGWLGLSRAVWFAASFLTIMFLFLLIAIERHQRKIAARMS